MLFGRGNAVAGRIVATARVEGAETFFEHIQA
jgi:hypothetical protein